MKIKIVSVFVVLIVSVWGVCSQNNEIEIPNVMLDDIEALATDGSDSGYSCSVTSNCAGNTGSVSCTGQICERGLGWVKCDGKKTVC